jgi:hypothetical protein
MRRSLVLLALLVTSPLWAMDGKAPRGWATVHCKDTRARVIEAQGTVLAWNSKGCAVKAARWGDPYSGAEITADSFQAMDIDHVIPVSIAWERRNWTLEEWKAFYNDMANLLLVRARYNRQKKDRMPNQWCPANTDERPKLAKIVFSVSIKYHIPLTVIETDGLKAWAKGGCYPDSKVIGN